MSVRSSSRLMLILVAVGMVLSFAPPQALIHFAGANTIVSWSDGSASQTLIFSSGESKVLNIDIPNDAFVEDATMNILSAVHPADGTYPSDIELDVGDETAWAFRQDEGAIGSLGEQYKFTDGSTSATFDFGNTGGTFTNLSIRVPKGATVKGVGLTATASGSSLRLVKDDVLSGTVTGGHFGFSAAMVGDVNVDGYNDIVVGARDANSAYLYYGGPSFDRTPDLTFYGTPGEEFGQAVSGIGDFNGDGFGDMAISENSTVYIYFGGADINNTPDMVLRGPATSTTGYGVSIAGGSDLNGDGGVDVVVGDWLNDIGSYWTGKVYVYFGGKTIADNITDVVLEGPPIGWFGWSVAMGGDIDGDGRADLVVGAPAACGSTTSSVHIYRGGPWFGGPANVTISGTISDMKGYSVAIAGDVNGDGIDDLLVGEPGSKKGAVLGFLGRSSWPASPTADFTISGDADGDYFGTSVAYLSDLDGDKNDDFAVGAPLRNVNGMQYAGSAYVIQGGPSPVIDRSLLVTGTEKMAETGFCVGHGGDIDMDGGADLFISSVATSSGKGSVQVLDVMTGLREPSLTMADVPSGPIGDQRVFNGTVVLSFPVSDIQAFLNGAATNFTDKWGNQFIDLPFVVRSTGTGTMGISSLKVEYLSSSIGAIGFTKQLNDYLAGTLANGGNKAGDIIDVPITITVKGQSGVLWLEGLKVIYTPNMEPVAVIDSIFPTTVEVGETVMLMGHGEDDGSIKVYKWTSDIDGILGSEPSINITLRTTGTHVITFDVRDDKGRWSAHSQESIIVVPRNDPPILNVDSPRDGDMIKGIVKVTGHVSDSNENDVIAVQVKVDDGDWEKATGGRVWLYSWDTANASEGPHTISAMASDGNRFSATITNNVTVVRAVPVITLVPPTTRTFEVKQGDTISFVYKVENNGYSNGTVRFEPVSHHFASLRFLPSASDGIVPPGGTIDLTIEAEVYHSTPVGSLFKMEFDAIISETGTTVRASDITIKTTKAPPGPSEHGVDLKVSEGTDTFPGSEVTYVIAVTNKGTVNDSYDVTLQANHRWLMSTSSFVVEDLGPGMTANMTLRFFVPWDAVPGIKHDLEVTVRSRRFVMDNATAHILTLINGRDGQGTPPTTLETIAVPLAVPALGGVLLLALLAPIVFTEWGKYKFFLFLIPLFTRIKKDMVLDNFTRGEINAFIRLNPGTFYNEIKRHLGISNGVLTYHLNKLEEEGYVLSRTNGRYKHYFTKGVKIPDVIVRLNEFQRAILKVIAEKPEISQKALAKELDVPQPTVQRHLVKLLEWGFITCKRWGGHLHYRIDTENAGGFLPDLLLPPIGSGQGQPSTTSPDSGGHL